MSLIVKDLTVGYGRHRVFRNIDLPEMPVGRVIAFVGPNGAGKSTMLRAMAGMIPATGHVSYQGRELLRLSSGERARIVGFMPQGIRDVHGLSVLESIIASLKVFAPGLSMPVCKGRALDVLIRVGIADLGHHALARLSGGQRQLASLAQSLVREPVVLLLDEPTSALDLRHQVEVMTLLRSLADEGRIIVVVLHDLSLAANWVDEIVILCDGRVHAAGPPRDVLASALFRDVYRVDACVGRTPDDGTYVLVSGLA